jgi:aspartyl/glutamyl-tRNA(Asn/Gln) amidotransferase C subunit
MDEIKKQIRKSASRLMLDIDPAEEEGLARYFEQILSFFHSLDEVDTSSVKHFPIHTFVSDSLRKDTVNGAMDSIDPADLTPDYDRDSNLFRVQPVMDKSSGEEK